MTAATESARLAEHVARLVAGAPPISPAVKRELTVLLRPAPVPHR